MKTYFLRVSEDAEDIQSWSHWSDVVWAVVVVANNEQEARQLAQEEGWREIEGGDVWLNPSITTCEEVRNVGVVMQKVS